MDLRRLIDALSKPAAYPYPVDAVEVRQTHISAVFLAGPYAYKVKKPVKLAFLDFSTLEKCFHCCEDEVRLNRRLAPHVYLGVVPVVQTVTGLQFEGQGRPVEGAVKMQRLPDEATLWERLGRGEVGVELIELLAHRIACFHQGADRNERIASFGRSDAITNIVLGVFGQAAPHVGTTVSMPVLSRIKTQAEAELSRLGTVMDVRAARGMPRDCHGDMHLDHIYYFPDQKQPADLVVIDCIEFNERFRFIDPVADMAFPAMDLKFHGRRDLAAAFADAYFRDSGDEDGRALLSLYIAYRAMVRGMVEGIELTEKEIFKDERTAVLARARRHWLLALTELEQPGQKPCLVLVIGLPGTGKSTLAQGLAQRADFSVIRSDVVRKELAPFPGLEQAHSQFSTALYNPEWNERTYNECLRRAERLLFEGRRVLVDATFREERTREAFLNAAIQFGVPAVILLCHADPETVQRRLQLRQGDASDANWPVYLQLAANWGSMGGAVRQVLHTIPTADDPEQVVVHALKVLRHLGLHG